ncbi:hypothetical protein RDWZM_002866 [Blomia tropicalis]|uniref:Large ribosomal subunit protein mL49 n=1 Tax=Blomia tropicalis TaxID=40697 RepID=A0A9Q0RSJ6_BLOTA|nr:hypothetical protein RDWZM_002866 [Blomia tropicalis]
MFTLTSQKFSQVSLRLIVNPLANKVFRRSYIKDYDKKILLEPDNVEYRYDDNRFLPGPRYSNEAYIKPTDEEIVEMNRIKLDIEIENQSIVKVDPLAKPYNQVLKGYEDGGRFTKTELIPDLDTRWPWVERLLPKKVLEREIRQDSQIIQPIPKNKPDLPYFVARTRSRVYPIYRKYEIVDRDHNTYWRNRWDGLFNKYHTDILDNLDEIKWENNEKLITITEVGKIFGNIWKFEKDARTFLEQRHKDELDATAQRIETSVNEVRYVVQFKGDYISDMLDFLKEKGF